MQSFMSLRRLFVAIILSVHAAMLAWSATRHAPTYDEVAWLPAGLSHCELGRFDLARVNPPLVRMVASLPAIFAQHKVDWTHYHPRAGGRPEFQVGVDFMRANGPGSFRLYTLARWSCIPFSLLGAYLCYRWASTLYGLRAGRFSLLLWCFCPNVVAHAELITSDVAAAALGCAACHAFWSWLRHPELQKAWMSGLLLGLAQLTKTTWLLLFLYWLIAWAFWRSTERPRMVPSRTAREAASLGAIFLLAMLVVNLGYGFEGSFKPLGDFPFVSRVLTKEVKMPSSRMNRFRDSWLASIPVPLPENYLLGIDQTKAEFESGKWSYLRGEWTRGGWWYYYLYALGVKVPLSTWLLGLLAATATMLSRQFRRHRRDELFLLLPAVLVVLLVSSQTGSNRHLRYLLPAFPFVFVWLGKLAAIPERNEGGCGGLSLGPWLIRRTCRSFPWLCGAALACSIASCLTVYPHCIAYFNRIGGGPLGGHAHLVDSNIDWGQDLLYLRAWLDGHPEARPLRLAYFGLADPRLAGIDFELPTRLTPPGLNLSNGRAQGPQPGWYAVSVNFLRGYPISAFDGSGGRVGIDRAGYTYFQLLRPLAVAGRSIYIYHVTPDDANDLRDHLGLPGL